MLFRITTAATKEMTMRHFIRHSIRIFATLVLIGAGVTARAADAPAPTPHAIKKPSHHVHKPARHAGAHASAQQSEAARREREHRDDLERRVEHLEQQNEMKQPNMPPPDQAR